MTVPRQRFTDELVVGAMAFANANGTLIGGVDRVRFRFEGNSVDVIAPSFHTFTDARGVERTYYGYWATLKKPSATSGQAQLYVEAIPADATMQNRVIGPFEFSLATTLYDDEITVTPSSPEVTGENYHTVSAAITYHASSGNDATLITVTETLTEALSATGSSTANSYCVVDATAPVTFSRASYLGDLESRFFVGPKNICFRGPNITFDLQYVSRLDRGTGDGGEVWFDGCNITNSGGRAARWRSTARPVAYVANGAPYFTEVNFSNLPNVAKGVGMVRGCIGTNLYADFSGDTGLCAYNSINSLDSYQDWLLDKPALEVVYTGAEATATLAKNGSSVFTATWGANTATTRARSTEAQYDLANGATYDPTTAGEIYYVQDLADWINSLSGWAATVLDNSTVASAISIIGQKGSSFSATSVKTTAHTFVSCFDLHGDFYQINGVSGAFEQNIIIFANTGINMRCQNFFMQADAGNKDVMILNNALSNVPITGAEYGNSDELRSGFGGINPSHVVFAHNSLPTHRLDLANGDDLGGDYCLVACNAMQEIFVSGGAALREAMVVKDNAKDAGFTAISGSTGTIIGGTYLTKHVASVTGDFAPAGELLANLKAPVLSNDVAGEPRSDLGSVGAVA